MEVLSVEAVKKELDEAIQELDQGSSFAVSSRVMFQSLSAMLPTFESKRKLPFKLVTPNHEYRLLFTYKTDDKYFCGVTGDEINFEEYLYLNELNKYCATRRVVMLNRKLGKSKEDEAYDNVEFDPALALSLFYDIQNYIPSNPRQDPRIDRVRALQALFKWIVKNQDKADVYVKSTHLKEVIKHDNKLYCRIRGKEIDQKSYEYSIARYERIRERHDRQNKTK